MLNDGLGMPGSYYVATANPFAARPALGGGVEADVVVVGGGCTGLAAALGAAEHGFSTVLLEAGRIGWGASGRNGGQLIPGLRKGALELVRLYGRDDARRLLALALEARAEVLELIRRPTIQCDLRLTGHLEAAIRPGDLNWMQREVDCQHEVMGYRQSRVLKGAEIAAEIATDSFHGGLLDAGGGHLHPLNYAYGLAEAAEAAGARLYEQTAALSVEAGGRLVRTAAGEVRARYTVLACDALLGDLDPQLARFIMPVANYIVATERLPDPAGLIPHDRAVSDSRFVVNYFRRTVDGRLLFGGGERYTPRPPADIPGFVRPYMLRLFPQLAVTKIEYGWGGLVSITTSRLPHVGRRGDMFFAQGYSGQGMLLATLAGRLIAEAMAGTAERFDIMAKVSPRPFPGGTALRYPLHVLGMLWYALRDRL